MSVAERLVAMDDAQAGMTLARDLLDARGQVLIAQGVDLGESALSSLRRRDIQEVWVLDPQAGGPSADADAADLRQRHEERLARLFRKLGDSAEDRFLLAVVRRYRGLAAP